MHGDLLIIGAGATGVSAFVNAVRTARHRSIRIVDPRDVGRGMAFGESHPDLLTNSSCEANSLVPDEPYDFVDYLRGRGLSCAPHDVVPRGLLGEYVAQRFEEYSALAVARGIQVERTRARARCVGKGTGGYRVELSDGTAVRASDVVVAAGLEKPRVPELMRAHQDDPAFLPSPFPADRLSRRVPPGSRVLVLGSRQSAVDAALLLCGDGSRVTMASPSGQLPAVRTATPLLPASVTAAKGIASLDPSDPRLASKLTRIIVESVRQRDARPLREQITGATDPVHRLRAEIALAESGACAWQDVAVGVSAELAAWLPTLPPPARSSVLRAFHTVGRRYATALILPNARKLLGHIDRGALCLARDYPVRVRRCGPVWSVQWPDGDSSTVDRVVSACGYEPPALWHDPTDDSIHLEHAPLHALPVDRLAADLRIRTSEEAPPENIWVVGAATHVRVLFFATLLYIAAHQAKDVALQLGASPMPALHELAELSH
ncbi:FAD/NAD(P)-binding protein [Streptomyces sp. NPDC041068]|uniref:FAD/NAD(P)-binding protein n=1 Tax=Streptomyces sp. NPDC041068 TaxID=3155130 RepID=UPI0033EF915F